MSSLFPNGLAGLSDSKWQGAPGSAHRVVGVDYRSTPGLIKVHQKLTKNSGSTVTELCKHRIAASNGTTLWFSAESGKIWREIGGTWTLVHTTVPTSGGAACLGAHEFENWIYWATENYLHRIHVNDIGGTWASFIYENWEPFAVGDDEAHPMAEQNLALLIGDKTGIARVDSPSTAILNPSETLTTALGSLVDNVSIGGLLNPSGDAFPALLYSARDADAYPKAGVTIAASLLVVAGGGGGGGITNSPASGGGGGGAGGVVTGSYPIAEGTHSVTVGAGGAGGVAATQGANGGNSVFGSEATAVGGGGGGANATSPNGLAGGSGGGGGAGNGSGGASTVGQGSNGGAVSAGGSGIAGAGGGGASAVGGSVSGAVAGGVGGAGVASTITGSSVTYAGGGGGGAGNSGTGGGAGTGGGGAGGAVSGNGGSATANTGGGGGGAGYTAAGGRNGGAGGSGIVVISYPTNSLYVATGGTITTSGGNTIHTFTSSGTFAIFIKRSSFTKTITVPRGHDRALLLLVANYTSEVPASATFDGLAMTSVTSGTASFAGGPNISYRVLRLLDPPVTTADIVVTWAQPTLNALLHAVVYDGVNQTTPVTGFSAENATATSASQTLESTADYQTRIALVLSETATHTPDDGQTLIAGGANGAGTDSSSYIGTTENFGFIGETDLNLKAPERITTLESFDIDLLIGTRYPNQNRARVLRWDTASESWSAEDALDESSVTAFIRDDNYVYVAAGEYGRLYFYNGEQLLPYKRVPGDWSPTQTAVIYPSAVAFLMGVPIFGLSNKAGNPALQGVYGFGGYSKDYPKTLSLDYPISSGNFSGASIGAILVKGSDAWVAWKDGSGAGVDKLDYSAKYPSAYIETMMLTPLQDRSRLKSSKAFYADYASLPATTGITFGVKKKHETEYANQNVVTNTKLNQVYVKTGAIPDVAALQVRIGFTASGNTAPEVENIGCDMAA